MAKGQLSGLFEEVRGRVGQSVVVTNGGRVVIRNRPRYRQGLNPAMEGARTRLQKAHEVWRTLDRTQVEIWNHFAAPKNICGFNAFIGLATRFLQASPIGAVPTSPPSKPFIGDSVIVTAAGSAGAVIFQATSPNSADVVTELMVQRLANERRAPGKVYKSAAFHRFVSGALSLPLPLEPGWYATAYRFVETATGQATDVLLCGVVQIV